MNISKRRLFALLSLCLLASIGSAHGDENAPNKVPAESYELQVFFGGIFPQKLPPQITTVIQVESPFKARSEESVSTLQSPSAANIFEALGTLHAPQNGKFKLDYKLSELSTPDGAGLGHEGSADLELDKPYAHYTSAGIVRGFRVLLTKAKDGTKLDEVTTSPNRVIEQDISWGKAEAGIQLGFGPAAAFYKMMQYLEKRLEIGDTAEFQLLVRNNLDRPVTVTLHNPRCAWPTVVDSEGKICYISQPILDGPLAVTLFKRKTEILEPGQVVSLGTPILYLRSSKSSDLFPSLLATKGKYRFSYKWRIGLLDADNKPVDLDLTTGEREFALIEKSTDTKELTP